MENFLTVNTLSGRFITVHLSYDKFILRLIYTVVKLSSVKFILRLIYTMVKLSSVKFIISNLSLLYWVSVTVFIKRLNSELNHGLFNCHKFTIQ